MRRTKRSGNLENYHRYQRFPVYPVHRPPGLAPNRRSRRHHPEAPSSTGPRRRWVRRQILRLLGGRNAGRQG